MFDAFFCRATREERSAALPGDAEIANPLVSLDHALDVAAPPEAVWPWLAQMGAWPKAGWYSYDILDNRGHRSLRAIDPSLTDIALGSVFPALPAVTDCFILTEFEAERFLVLSVPGPQGPQGETGTAAWRRSFDRSNWTWMLTPTTKGTRIHVRARLGWLEMDLPLLGTVQFPARLARLIAAPVHFIMQQRQLWNIRRRAETD
ncbi:hypothetical protein [Oricola sp.]|uniref:hypothetical protein n=1 Tax=Oricola sp. TaxID=1979950 RepID=UPI0025EC8643|nr:hypothetical protein [Oricola sp.]MCI5077495.1 hypothetical protein [Oricola sp.]